MKKIKLQPNYDAVRNLSFEDFLQSLHDDEAAFDEAIELIGRKTYHYISDPVLKFVKKAIYGHIEYRGKWFDTQIIDKHNEWIVDSIGAANKAISAFEYETDRDGDPTEKWQSEVFVYCHNIEFALFMVYGDIEENIAPFLDYCEMCLYCGEYINLDNYEAISAAFEEADMGYYYSCDFEDGELPDEDTYEDEDYSANSANRNNTVNNGASTMVEKNNTQEDKTMTKINFNKTNTMTQHTIFEMIEEKRYDKPWLSFDDSTLFDVAIEAIEQFNNELDAAVRLLNNVIEAYEASRIGISCEEYEKEEEIYTEYYEEGCFECITLKDAIETVYNETAHGDIAPFMDYCFACWHIGEHANMVDYEKIRKSYAMKWCNYKR